MAEEDKKEVVGAAPPEDKKGDKHPDTVPWNEYVGIKESLGKKLDSERTKVSSLEEQLKKAVSPEEHDKVKGELNDAKTKLETATNELNSFKEKTLAEKRDTLTKRGVPAEKVKGMSEKELDGAFVVLQHTKPGSDIGGSGGSPPLTGNPAALANQAYSSSNK